MLFSRLLLAMIFSCGIRPPSISCQPPTRASTWSPRLEPQSLLRSKQQEVTFGVLRILLHLLADEHAETGCSA